MAANTNPQPNPKQDASLAEAKALINELNSLKARLGEGVSSWIPEKAVKDMGALRRELKSARAELEGTSDTASGLYGELRNITKEFGKQATEVLKTRGAFRKLEEAAQDLKYDEMMITDLNKKQIKAIQEKVEKNKHILDQESRSILNSNSAVKSLKNEIESYKKIAASEEEFLDFAASQIQKSKLLNNEEKALLQMYYDESNVLERIERQIEKRLEKEGRINKLMGVSGEIIGGIDGFMSKLGMNSGIFKDSVEKAKEEG